jgi:hypothetical protein
MCLCKRGWETFLRKKCPRMNILFLSMSIIVIENHSDVTHDRVTYIKILCYEFMMTYDEIANTRC